MGKDGKPNNSFFSPQVVAEEEDRRIVCRASKTNNHVEKKIALFALYIKSNEWVAFPWTSGNPDAVSGISYAWRRRRKMEMGNKNTDWTSFEKLCWIVDWGMKESIHGHGSSSIFPLWLLLRLWMNACEGLTTTTTTLLPCWVPFVPDDMTSFKESSDVDEPCSVAGGEEKVAGNGQEKVPFSNDLDVAFTYTKTVSRYDSSITAWVQFACSFVIQSGKSNT